MSRPKVVGICLGILLLAATAFAGGQNYVQGLYLTFGGDNNARISIVRAETSGASVLDFLFTTSDTKEFRITADALAMGTNALEFGATSEASTWSIDYVSANKARIADSDILAFGAGDDAAFVSDETNLDVTIGTLATFGDGGTTNYSSLSATGALNVLGSATWILQDSVEFKFGTSGAESEIASGGTDTVWTTTSGDLVLGTDGFLTRVEGAMQLGAISTMGTSDATPDVSGNSFWQTGGTGDTIDDFDGSGIEAGQLLFVISKAAIVYDVDGGLLEAGSGDITTASGDLTVWLYDGTDWILIKFTDMSDDLS